MLKFVFLLTIWNSDGAIIYVEDHNLTGEDCTRAIVQYVESDPAKSLGEPSCELDHASQPAVFSHKGRDVVLPACQFEDSQNCYWDAGVQGNAYGQSFYDVAGERYTFHP